VTDSELRPRLRCHRRGRRSTGPHQTATAARLVELRIKGEIARMLSPPIAATDISLEFRNRDSASGHLLGRTISAFTTFGTASPRSAYRAATASTWSARYSGIVNPEPPERYAHLGDDPVRAVANRASETIAAIMQRGAGMSSLSPFPAAINRRCSPLGATFGAA